MKKIAVWVLLTLGIVSISVAQNEAAKGKGKGKGNATPEMKAQKITDKMEKELALNSDQKIKIYELNLARATKLTELKAKFGEDKKGMNKEMKPFNIQHKNQLVSVLDETQKEKLKQMREKRKENKAANGGKGKGKGKEAPATEDDILDGLD